MSSRATTERRSSRALLRRVVPRRLRRALWVASTSLERAQQRLFERRLGVSTGQREHLEQFGLESSERVLYDACEWLPVRRALRALRPGAADVLVDLGSGKGQGLLIAGRLPYGRVIGVELVDELTQAARRNLEQARPRLRAGGFETVTADVTEWEVPDDVTAVFLYCPFTGSVFHEAMRRIFASHDRRPRPLHIVYDYPWEHDWLMESGRVRLVDVLPAQWPAKPWWWRGAWAIPVYRVTGAGEGAPGEPSVRRRLFRPRRAIRRWSAPNGQRYSITGQGGGQTYSPSG